MDFDVIILAGGQSKRMGEDKAGIELNGKTLLEHVTDNARSWRGRRILVAGPPRDWLKAEYISDPPGFEPSSLLGFYAGLMASSSAWKLVCGCDMPFIRQEVVEMLWSARKSGGAVAMWGNRLQPLPGLYPREAEGVIAEMLREKRYHLAALLDKLNPAIVGHDQVAACDPSGSSFFNINSREDLFEAELMAKSGQAGC